MNRLSLLFLRVLLTTGAVIAAFGDAHGSWPLNGTSVSTLAGVTQETPTIVSDGAGGAFIAWSDGRNGPFDIYAQRVDAFGAPQWTVNGIAVCNAASNQQFPAIVSDGAGGMIVVWYDQRNGGAGDIYAQRVNAAGVPLWTTNGVAVCTATLTQTLGAVVSDGAGGVLVTWYDFRSSNWDIYAQRMNGSGVALWTTNGAAVCTAASNQQFPAIVSDGAGGAIVTWQDMRIGGQLDIYAQRMDAAGTPLWLANGVILCAATLAQQYPKIVADGAGGAIVAWEDNRDQVHIYAQRVNSTGTLQWSTDGNIVAPYASAQFSPVLLSDGAGGAYVVWMDSRGGVYPDLYMQLMAPNGNYQWGVDGKAICTAPFDQQHVAIVSDGAGGAIMTWDDYRGGGNYDIYAQRVNALGSPHWTANGVAVATPATTNQETPAIALDGAGGAIITWKDSKNGSPDIYAQRVDLEHGFYGHPEPFIVSASDAPNDQGGHVVLNWRASDHDAHPEQVIAYYSVWRSVDVAPFAGVAAENGLNIVDPASVGSDFQGPAYRAPDGSSLGYYWEFVHNVPARYASGYSDYAPTREDSTSESSADHFFQVLAHTSNTYIFYTSNVVTGHSIDNLAPPAPLSLVAQRTGNDVYLKWNGVHVPDFKNYSVYRKTSSGVTPAPINFLSSANDTVLTDTSAPTSVLYYIVTAHDVHANQSAPSNEASVQAFTGVGNTPPITALTVLENMPNPFNERTTLRVGLPMASEIEVEVFDVAGRRMRIARTATLAAGWRELSFDAHDAAGQKLPSGVYFYRVRAAGETITRKMVIAR